MKRHSIPTLLLSAIGVAASSAVSFAGCGGSFDVPKDHFDGVDNFGFVSYWDKIADIDIGEDQPLPLVIGFKSNRDTSSPCLGHGWVMPLLDSYMVQTGENTFEIMKPTGWTSGFGRDPKSATTIGGVKGWKGEIGSNTIKVWAPCGCSLTYTMGRLTEMGTPKGKRILVKRDFSGQVEDVAMDGRVLVKVVKGLGGKVEGLEVQRKSYEIALKEKPRMQSVQGRRVVVGKDLSLGTVGTNGVPFKSYEYGLTEALQPKLTATDTGERPREITWDPAPRHVISDEDWTYEIHMHDETYSQMAILRASASGKKERWEYDKLKGEEVTVNTDGLKQVKTSFTSGLLQGKLRRIETSLGGLPIAMVQKSFDENGRLLSYRENGFDAEKWSYGADGVIQKIQIGNGCVEFLEEGFLKAIALSDNVLWTNERH